MGKHVITDLHGSHVYDMPQFIRLRYLGRNYRPQSDPWIYPHFSSTLLQGHSSDITFLFGGCSCCTISGEIKGFAWHAAVEVRLRGTHTHIAAGWVVLGRPKGSFFCHKWTEGREIKGW